MTMIIYKKDFHLKLLPKYGDLVRFNIGGIPFYEINDAVLTEKIFSKALNRTHLGKDLISRYGFETPVSGANNDEKWEHRRKTIMRNLNKILNKFSGRLCCILSMLCNYTSIGCIYFEQLPQIVYIC